MNDADAMSHPLRLHVVYDGPALELNRMDVRDLAPALLAFGALLDRANEVLNQDRASIRVEVQASFKAGSFGIDFEVMQALGARMLNILAGNPVTGTLNLVALLGLANESRKGALWLIRKLKGRKLERAELLPDGKATVLIDNEQNVVELEVLQLVRDYRIRQHFEKLIAQPLERDGIETFAIADAKTKKVEVLIGQDEARYFMAPPPDEDQEEVIEYVARLQIVSLSFQDGNKWRFSDGQQSFHAAILDEKFNDRIARREAHFAKDDIIRARVRRRQYVADGKLRAEHAILEVLAHTSVPPAMQGKLELPPPAHE